MKIDAELGLFDDLRALPRLQPGPSLDANATHRLGRMNNGDEKSERD
jgi:hypothetical protein